jgi:hypothetical protein
MAWKRNILVVANVTATSDELVQALRDRAVREAVSVELIIPATPFGGGKEAANEQLSLALELLQQAGVESQGTVGHADPIVAVTDSWDPRRHDEIIVSTLPMRLSQWLHAGLPERISRATGAPVMHVVSQPEKAAVESFAPPRSDDAGAGMGPLSVLAWGATKSH